MTNIAVSNKSYVELHVSDFEKVERFYIDILGFEKVREPWLEADKNYLVLERGGNLIAFWPGNNKVYDHSYFGHFPKDTKKGYGVELVFMIENIKDYYNKIKDRLNIVEELRTHSWGLMDFRVEDPFGFYLRFTEPYNLLKGPKGDLKKLRM